MSLEETKKLEQLKLETNRLETKIKADQDKCTHAWAKEVYDPVTKSVGHGYALIPELSHGSDPYFGFTGYHEEQVPRWKRTCTKCGKVQYADERETKVVDVGPKFKD